MSYPDGVLYFNSKELTEVCLNVMKKNNVQPIGWIINIQKFILNLINSTEYSEVSVGIFMKAGNIIDDLMILFEIKEMPKIQLDEQSRSNQEKWLKCHRLVNVKKMNLFCFTCLQF